MKKILFAVLALMICVTACVKDPLYEGIIITNVQHTPEQMSEFDDVIVSATISSFYEFDVKLHYIAGEEKEQTLDMKPEAPISIEEGKQISAVFFTSIPAQALNTKVTYWIVASNDNTVSESAKLEYEIGAVVIDYTKLRLNELNGNDKFIEIYNAGDQTIPIAGIYIEKDGAAVWPKTGLSVEGLMIEPDGYLLLYSDKMEGTHPDDYPENLFFAGGLSAKKAVRVQLFALGGISLDDFNLVECVTPAEASYSRNADGIWHHAEATPGAANIDGIEIVLGLEGGDEPPPEEPDYTNLVLNELNGGFKFIELYNKGGLPLVLDGMRIDKDDEKTIWTAENVTIPAGGYILLYSDREAATYPGHPENLLFEGGLSSKKTVMIELFMEDGTSRDVFTRGVPTWGGDASDVGNKSMARTPDGGDWKLVEEATPGTANPDTGDEIPL